MKLKYILWTGLLFLCLNFVKAQVITNYTLDGINGTFTALSGANSLTLSAGDADDGYFNAIPIGFDFWYMGTRYTTVSASTNGWLTFGANITNAVYVNSLANSGTRPLVAPLWDDIDIQTATNVTYLTSGTAPNRIFTLQYLNAQWQYTATGNSISFQVKLYETTGEVQFIYRPESGSLTTPSASAQPPQDQAISFHKQVQDPAQAAAPPRKPPASVPSPTRAGHFPISHPLPQHPAT